MTAKRAIHLVRHADTLERATWTKPDRARPLSERGTAQARLIGENLATRPIMRIISSPYVRCVATLEPLGQLLGLEVESADYLAEGRDTSRVVARLLEDALKNPPEKELAACSHGDIVPFVVAELAHAGGIEPEERSSPKGVIFTFVLEDSHVAAIHRARPPRP